MKIVLLGKGGQVGRELLEPLATSGTLVASDRTTAALTRPETVVALLRREQPDVIVNAAAYTAVDKAETDADRAKAVNATTPGLLAREAASLGAWLVHYSTDYVFDGSGNRAWAEADTPAPLSVYGRTKLEGERLIQTACAQHLIFRTSWVYAARGGNFAKTMLRLAQERERLTVIDDQFGAPTGAELIADVTAHAVRQCLRQPHDAGLYHLAASGETSWHGYANQVLACARLMHSAIKIKASEVVAVPSSAFATAARRPLNSRLDTQKLQDTFGLALPEWEQGVGRMMRELA